MAKNAAAAALQANFARRDTTPGSESKAQEPANAGTEAPKTGQASRDNKINLAVWLHPDYKKNLALCKAYTGINNEKLVAEALNMLFEKYKVPTVSE